MSKENGVANNERGKLLEDLIKEQCTLEDLAELLKPLLKGESSEAREESLVGKRPVRKMRIAEILLELGIPARLGGYDYITQSIEICYNDGKKLRRNVCKGLYCEIAQANNTTPSRVERAIRHAIERMCDRASPQVLEKYFGNTMAIDKGKPTNTEFLAAIVTYLKLEEE